MRDRARDIYRIGMRLLAVTDERCALHIAGRGHPEQPGRLGAMVAGITDLSLGSDCVTVVPDLAPDDALQRVHGSPYIHSIIESCGRGGTQLDPDTATVSDSLVAARLAAGSGLQAMRALSDGLADVALCAVRPPGHHARPHSAMGFCLFNNVAVVAAALADRGERVLIVDVDVHHGNGTQEIFWDDPRVAYVSIHQWPLYPGTGAADETGGLGAPGGILNIPLPAGATGDVYMAAIDSLVLPFASMFVPDWLCISLGFDAHRSDPLANMALSSRDFTDMIGALVSLVPVGRCIAMVEGGYDLDALRMSMAASIAGLLGERFVGDARTNGGPGRREVDQLVAERTGGWI